MPGLTVSDTTQEVSINGDKKKVLEGLIEKYQNLFGRASVEVCRDAVSGLIHKLPQDQIPSLLLH